MIEQAKAMIDLRRIDLCEQTLASVEEGSTRLVGPSGDADFTGDLAVGLKDK